MQIERQNSQLLENKSSYDKKTGERNVKGMYIYAHTNSLHNHVERLNASSSLCGSQFCCSYRLLPVTALPPEKLQVFAIYYVLHTSIKNPHLRLICHSTESLSLALSLPLPIPPQPHLMVPTGGHCYILSRPPRSEVWCPHAWMAE